LRRTADTVHDVGIAYNARHKERCWHRCRTLGPWQKTCPARRSKRLTHRSNHPARRSNHPARRSNHPARRSNHPARRSNRPARRSKHPAPPVCIHCHYPLVSFHLPLFPLICALTCSSLRTFRDKSTSGASNWIDMVFWMELVSGVSFAVPVWGWGEGGGYCAR